MTDTGLVIIYVNAVAVMLSVGVMALARRFRMEDPWEKKIFLGLQAIVIAMACFYVLCSLRDDKVIAFSKAGAMAIETVLELLVNVLAVEWFIYMDYRIFHSVSHVKRIAPLFMIPFTFLVIMDIINAFTGFMLRFEEDGTLTELPIYVLMDLLRVGYFTASLVVLYAYKKQNERMKFFRVSPFFIPIILYLSIYYVSDYATPALGLSIGFALLFTEMVNEQCYQDYETGFYNRLYLDYMRGEIKKGKYNLESAIVFKLKEGVSEDIAKMISKQLPRAVVTFRYGKDKILTLAKVNDRGSLHMVSEDVTDSLAASNIEVSIRYDLKKKKENGTEFLNRFLEKE